MNHPQRGLFIFVGWLTGSRLVFAAGVAVLTPWLERAAWATIASLALMALVESTDLLDGRLARSRGVVSEFGKMFDPYCDSVSRLIIYWSLAVIGQCLAVVPLVMAVRDVTVGYARVVMTRKGADVSARLTGKIKAVVQGGCAFALMAARPGWVSGPARTALFWAGSLAVLTVTVASMVDYLLAALRASGGVVSSPEDPSGSGSTGS